MGQSNKTNTPAAKRRQQPAKGQHAYIHETHLSIRDRTPWLTVLSPLRGYCGLVLRSPWADAHGYLLSPHSRLLGNDANRLAERIGDRRVLSLLSGLLFGV